MDTLTDYTDENKQNRVNILLCKYMICRSIISRTIFEVIEWLAYFAYTSLVFNIGIYPSYINLGKVVALLAVISVLVINAYTLKIINTYINYFDASIDHLNKILSSVPTFPPNEKFGE